MAIALVQEEDQLQNNDSEPGVKEEQQSIDSLEARG
jgi:hypothetical protein